MWRTTPGARQRPTAWVATESSGSRCSRQRHWTTRVERSAASTDPGKYRPKSSSCSTPWNDPNGALCPNSTKTTTSNWNWRPTPKIPTLPNLKVFFFFFHFTMWFLLYIIDVIVEFMFGCLRRTDDSGAGRSADHSFGIAAQFGGGHPALWIGQLQGPRRHRFGSQRQTLHHSNLR